jgi:hypothetical protein
MEFGLLSPLRVKCDDETIGFSHLQMFSKGEKEILNYFFKNFETMKINSKTKCLLKRMDRYLDIPLIQAVLDYRCSYDSFKRLIINDCTLIPKKFLDKIGLLISESIQDQKDPEVFEKAFHLMKHLGGEEDTNYDIYDVTGDAAAAGRLDIVKYIIEQHSGNWGNLPNPFTMRAAAAAGQLHCVKYLHQIKCQWNSDSTLAAAENGHYETLVYMIENGCPIHNECLSSACGSGSVECVRYLHQKGFKLTRYCVLNTIRHNQVQVLQYMIDYGIQLPLSYVSVCSRYGSLDALKFLYGIEGDKLLNCSLVETATECGHIHVLQYLLEIKCPFDKDKVLQTATHYGQFDCYALLMEHETIRVL